MCVSQIMFDLILACWLHWFSNINLTNYLVLLEVLWWDYITIKLIELRFLNRFFNCPRLNFNRIRLTGRKADLLHTDLLLYSLWRLLLDDSFLFINQLWWQYLFVFNTGLRVKLRWVLRFHNRILGSQFLFACRKVIPYIIALF